MSDIKRQKIEVSRKPPLVLNFFEHAGPSQMKPGLWAHPKSENHTYTTRQRWIKLAKIAERGKISSLFIGDTLSPYDVYKGPENIEPAAKDGVQFPTQEPTPIVPLLAEVTKGLAFGLTISTLVEPPYHLARRLAALDHWSDGRIGWNIVTSFNNSAAKNNLNGQDLPPNTERYAKAREYLNVVYELLLSSWSDDAVVVDKINRVYSQPDKIRGIDFHGEHFTVTPGFQFAEPSPQRLPVLIQAGSSPPGIEFGSKFAEIIFIQEETKENIKSRVESIRKTAKERHGRDPHSVKIIQLLEVYVAPTHEEAVTKFNDYQKYASDDGAQVLFGGWNGLDLSKYSYDEDLRSITSKPTDRGYLQRISQSPIKITRRTIVDKINGRNIPTTIVGSAKEVAQHIKKLVDFTDLDGFNFAYSVWPTSFEDIVDYLIPELQELGLAQKEYPVPDGTFRENLYRTKGHNFVPEDHEAYGYKWGAGVSKQQFEKQLKEHKKKLYVEDQGNI